MATMQKRAAAGGVGGKNSGKTKSAGKAKSAGGASALDELLARDPAAKAEYEARLLASTAAEEDEEETEAAEDEEDTEAEEDEDETEASEDEDGADAEDDEEEAPEARRRAARKAKPAPKASTPASTPATIAQLKALGKGADFALGCAEAGLTLAQARAMAATVATGADDADDLDDEAEEAIGSGSVAGVIGKGGGGGKDPAGRFEAMVRATAEEDGLGFMAAIDKCKASHPALYEASQKAERDRGVAIQNQWKHRKG